MGLQRVLNLSGMTEKPHIRLFVAAALAEGAALELAPEQAHYLKNVMRLAEGEAVALFNGRDGAFRARIAQVARRGMSLVVEARLRAQEAEPDLWLVFAPLKRARIDYLVEKATELGASALVPVLTRHTIVERLNLDRLRAHAIEAAEQSERLTVPRIEAPRALDALLAAWNPSRRIMLCDESGTAPPAATALQGQSAESWAVLIGPEGGFADDERAALLKLPNVVRLSLGPRILRADTAAVAALTLVQALIGDWR